MEEKRIKLTDVHKSQWRAQAGPIKPMPIKQIMQHLFTFAENTLNCSLQDNYSWKRTPQEGSSWHLTPAASMEQPWDTAVSHPLPLTGTSSPWECHPCWECHPRCCDIPSAGRWAWHHFVSPALRLWVLNWRSAALGSREKWRTLSLLWITTEWKFIYQYQQSIRATDTNSLLT